MFTRWVYSTNHKEIVTALLLNAVARLFSSVRLFLTLFLLLSMLNIISPLLKELVLLLLVIGSFFIPLLPSLRPTPSLITYYGVLCKLGLTIKLNYKKANTVTDYVCLIYQPFLVFQFIWFYFAFNTIIGCVVLYVISLSVGYWFIFGPTWCFFMSMQCITYSFSNAFILFKQLRDIKMAKRLLFEVVGDPAYNTYVGHNPTGEVVKTVHAPRVGTGIAIGLVGLGGFLVGSKVIDDIQSRESIDHAAEVFTKKHPNATPTEFTAHVKMLYEQERQLKEARGWKITVIHELKHRFPTVSEVIWGKAAIDYPPAGALPESKNLMPEKGKVWTWEWNNSRKP